MIDTIEKKSVEKQNSTKKEQSTPQKKYRFMGEKVETVKIDKKTYMLVPNRVYINIPDELLKQMKDEFKEV